MRIRDGSSDVCSSDLATGYDLKTGRPIENPEARFYRTGKPFIAIPGALGAHNWHPMSYNPKTGLVYIPAQQIPQGYLQDMYELEDRKSVVEGTSVSVRIYLGGPHIIKTNI